MNLLKLFSISIALATASQVFAQTANPAAQNSYSPFHRTAYLTSSFGENRGTRYHAGFDYSTQMEEGWPIYAPEDGVVKELRTSPYGYGKVMFFEGKSGKTWVFAHQSSFGKLDSLVFQEMLKKQKNDITIKPNVPFQKGDTLTFSGSSGIGNPHLHVETRLGKNLVINPVLSGTEVADTIPPQIFGAAVWQNNDIAFTGAEAIRNECIETPVKNEFKLNLAVKIADYSREPKENPMSVRRVTLRSGTENLFTSILDTLNFTTMIDIRKELLWTEEADTAGDWHFIDAKLPPLSMYTLEVEDYAGHITTQNFSFHQECKGNSSIPLTKVQESPVFSALAKTMLDLSQCESGMKFQVTGKKGVVLAENACETLPHTISLLSAVFEKYPTMERINYSSEKKSGEISVYQQTTAKNISWKALLGTSTFSQKIDKITSINDNTPITLAITRTHSDSLDFLEFHPKGLQFKGKWEFCIDSKTATAPLYWLGETSRKWFIFSKQKDGAMRCASTNELRDISWIDDKEPPSLGNPYWERSFIYGVQNMVLRIPVLFNYASIGDGNAITVKSGENWIPAEFDSEPNEIVLDGQRLPASGEKINIELEDEAKNKASYEIIVPEL